MFAIGSRRRAGPVEVIGLCRFSWPGLGGFKRAPEALEARTAALYDPARLEHRFRLFEAFTLPSLRAQGDGDFRIGIVIGPEFPQRPRLEALLRDLPQAVILERAPGPHREVMREAINSLRGRPDRASAQFRLDDDDAVGRDFVSRLRAAASGHAALAESRGFFAVDFPAGWHATAGPDGIRAAETVVPHLGVAFAIVFAAGLRKGVFDFAHNRVPRFMACASFPDPDMYVRGLHGSNDSGPGGGLRPMQLAPLDAAGEARFRQAFGIEADRVRALFAAPA